jgi:hypothetical protein
MVPKIGSASATHWTCDELAQKGQEREAAFAFDQNRQ